MILQITIKDSSGTGKSLNLKPGDIITIKGTDYKISDNLGSIPGYHPVGSPIPNITRTTITEVA